MNLDDAILLAVSLGFMVAGFLVAVIPASLLLQSDIGSAKLIYQYKLQRTDDEKAAVSQAAWFYKFLGTIVMLFGVAALLAFLVKHLSTLGLVLRLIAKAIV